MNRARLKLPEEISIHIGEGEAAWAAWLTWRAEYRPLPNHVDPNASYDGLLFETYGDELKAVRETPGPHVWTLIEEDGEQFIVSGYRHVNRLGYFVTEVGHA